MFKLLISKPILFAFLSIFLVVGIVIYFVLYTSPVSRPKSEKIANIAFEGNLKQLFKESKAGNKNESYIGISDVPDNCIEPPFPLEKQTVTLTGEQISEFIKEYKPSNIPVSNVAVWFKEGRIYGAGTSFYPALPGEIRVIADPENWWFHIKEVYLGQIKPKDAIVEAVDSEVTKLFYDFLAKVYVSASVIIVDDNFVTVEIESPKGLVSQQGGFITIDNNIMAQAIDAYNNCFGQETSGSEGDLKIMGY